MSRFTGHSGDVEDAEVDISPLIDCVFILLIFFIVATTFVEESGISLEKPQASPPTERDEESKTVVLFVTEAGDVLHEDRAIGLGEIQRLVRDSLRTDEELPVMVQAAPAASAGMLMRVVDQVKLAGAVHVNVATRRPRG